MIHLLELKEFLLSKSEKEWSVILSELDENSNMLMNFVRKAPAFLLKNEFAIKKLSTARAKIRVIGLDNLVEGLEKMHEKNVLSVQEVKTPTWVGFCVSEESGEIIGCAFVESIKKGKKTPPNWDGSIEELNKFNS